MRGLIAAACGLVIAAAVAPAPVAAQGGDGYLFRKPVVSFTIRAGYGMPRAGSDLFSFTQEQLTVEKSDFNMPLMEGRVAVRVTDRVDVMGTLGGGSSTTRSVVRGWDADDGLPIAQTTTFSNLRITFGARAYLMDRGRSVGRFAWIPTRFAPYVGADAGWVFHGFEQEGEFLDYATARIDPETGDELVDIFSDRFYSDGSAPTVQLLGGVDISLNNRVLFNTEARYGWGSAELSSDFVGFEKLDLAGLQLTAGFTVRF